MKRIRARLKLFCTVFNVIHSRHIVQGNSKETLVAIGINNNGLRTPL